MEHFYLAFGLMEIFHELYDILKPYEEINGFGFNPKTLFFLLTIFWSTMSAVALAAQAKKIKQRKSGESISFLFYCFFILPVFGVGIYGYYRLKFSLILNAIGISIFGLRVIFNLLKYQKYSRKEIIFGFSAVLSIPLIILVPANLMDLVFFSFGIIVILMMLKQTWLIWEKKDAGSFHPGPAINGIFSASSWLVYAFLMDIWPMQIFNGVAAISWAIQVISYYLYNKKEAIT